jgi:hypothetical protein
VNTPPPPEEPNPYAPPNFSFAPPPEPQPAREKPNAVVVLSYVCGALSLVVLLAMMFKNMDLGDKKQPAAKPAATALWSDEDEDDWADEDWANEDLDAELPSTTAPTREPEFPSFAPVVYKGSGDQKISIKDTGGPAIAVVSHARSDGFIMSALGKSGGIVQLLTAHYPGTATQGTVLFNDFPKEVSGFKITSRGDWTVTVKPLADAKAWDGATPVSGKGDQVLVLSRPLPDDVLLGAVHNGKSNFFLSTVNSRRGGTPVNAIGAYDGQATLGAGSRAVTVVADGAWTLTPR